MNRTLAASAAALLALTSAVARAQPPPAPAPSAAPAPSTDPNGAAPPGDANAPPGGASAPPGDAAGAPAGEPTAAAAAGASAKEGPVEVRVIGDKADSLQKVPGSGTVVTRQEIQRADPYNMAEMLRRVPGVQVREEFGGGQRLDISVRGLEAGRSRRVLVLEDGVPISLNPYAEPDLYYAPPVERMRGIEVVKGSGSILFGPQTIGGVVNFLTLAPEDRQRAAVDFEGGNLGYMRGLAMYGDSFHGVRHVTQVLYRRGNERNQISTPAPAERGGGAMKTATWLLTVLILSSTQLSAKVSQGIKAINYKVQGGSTTVDFVGTEQMPKAKGEAKVESKKGYIEIEVEFQDLGSPMQFGTEYLTYVLWAVSPEGRTVNLGELVVKDGKAKLNVTSDLQVFAMGVTAEPYFAVRLPSSEKSHLRMFGNPPHSNISSCEMPFGMCGER